MSPEQVESSRLIDSVVVLELALANPLLLSLAPSLHRVTPDTAPLRLLRLHFRSFHSLVERQGIFVLHNLGVMS